MNALKATKQTRQEWTRETNSNANLIIPKLVCGKKGHEMKVCHAYTRQKEEPLNNGPSHMQTSNQMKMPNPIHYQNQYQPQDQYSIQQP